MKCRICSVAESATSWNVSIEMKWDLSCFISGWEKAISNVKKKEGTVVMSYWQL